jgi:hypothetical protein
MSSSQFPVFFCLSFLQPEGFFSSLLFCQEGESGDKSTFDFLSLRNGSLEEKVWLILGTGAQFDANIFLVLSKDALISLSLCVSSRSITRIKQLDLETILT